MESVEAEGDSIDTAIDSALHRLGVERDRVEIEILHNASRGLFGLGGRKARVRATVRRAIDGDEAGADPIAAPAGGAAGIAGASPIGQTPAAVDRETAARARAVLQDIVRHVGVEADVAVRVDDGQVVLDLAGETTGLLIGRRGQMLDALEYVINRITAKDMDESSRIVVDSQNYRARRRESLELMARRLGEQAKKRRRPVSLNPMSPRDRRIVHLLLQDDPSLTTKSSGKGFFRRLIIIPQGARGNRSDP